MLVLCRRRCCICFALNRDTELKKGQIAHLNRDRANSELDNLAFLCLEHHDEYDSSTSQAKGLTINEIRHFRIELHEAIARAWKLPVRFGEVEIASADPVEGRFVRRGEYDFAELQVRRVGATSIQVSGLALWGTHREAPSNGVVEFEVALQGNVATYVDERMADGQYRLQLTFMREALVVHEQYVIAYHGHNVTFEGVDEREEAVGRLL